MNSVFLFNKYKKIFFSFLAAGFCPKNLVFARKNNGFGRVWGAAAPLAPWGLARGPMLRTGHRATL